MLIIYPTRREMAAIFLHDFLTEHGETQCSEIDKAASEAGFTIGTLKNAAQAMGSIVSRKLGTNRGYGTWRLEGPDDYVKAARVKAEAAAVRVSHQ